MVGLTSTLHKKSEKKIKELEFKTKNDSFLTLQDFTKSGI